MAMNQRGWSILPVGLEAIAKNPERAGGGGEAEFHLCLKSTISSVFLVLELEHTGIFWYPGQQVAINVKNTGVGGGASPIFDTLYLLHTQQN